MLNACPQECTKMQNIGRAKVLIPGLATRHCIALAPHLTGDTDDILNWRLLHHTYYTQRTSGNFSYHFQVVVLCVAVFPTYSTCTFYLQLSRDIVDARYHLFSSQSSFCLLLYLFNTMQFVSPGNITEESQKTQKDNDLVKPLELFTARRSFQNYL